MASTKREGNTEKMESLEVDELVTGQAEVWQRMFAFADSLLLKCAVELRIPDIIHSHGGPVTMSQIATSIGSPNLNISYLARIMRFLVRKKIFTIEYPSDGGEALYGLTNESRLLTHDSNWTLAPMLLFLNHPLAMAPWHSFSQCVKEGGDPFTAAHGCDVWEFASKHPHFNKTYNDGMACTNPIMTRGIIAGYKEGFDSIGSLVDVGGGVGFFLAEIVKFYPHIRGINFDLPHVIDTAPEYEGITHVAGNMFETNIPNADAVVLKNVLHDWGDEDCVNILKNCRRSINEKTGKIIVVDRVLDPEGDHPFDDARLVVDLLMMAHTTGGQQRTKQQWKKILEEAGFPRFKITNVPALVSVIEAYPA